jgi:hypothetical protein
MQAAFQSAKFILRTGGFQGEKVEKRSKQLLRNFHF